MDLTLETYLFYKKLYLLCGYACIDYNEDINREYMKTPAHTIFSLANMRNMGYIYWGTYQFTDKFLQLIEKELDN